MKDGADSVYVELVAAIADAIWSMLPVKE